MPLNNDLKGSSWILQDPMPNVPVKSGLVKVSSLSFEGYSNQDHHCMVKDGHGAMIFETYGNVDLSPIQKHFEGYWVWNMELTALDSGRVVVTIE